MNCHRRQSLCTCGSLHQNNMLPVLEGVQNGNSLFVRSMSNDILRLVTGKGGTGGSVYLTSEATPANGVSIIGPGNDRRFPTYP